MALQTDYLIIGGGASAMGFLDAMFHHSQATFTIVDRNDAPGGTGTMATPSSACISRTTSMGSRRARWAMTGSTFMAPMQA